MAAPSRLRCAREDPVLLKERDEVIHVRSESPAIAPADPDVDVIPFPHAPPVPLQVTAEEQLGCALADVRVVAVQKKLGFFRDEGREIVASASKVTRHRAEMPAGADDDPRFDRLVGNPRVAVPPERRDARVLEDAHVCAAQEEVVELTAADCVAYDTRVSRLHPPPGGDTGTAR